MMLHSCIKSHRTVAVNFIAKTIAVARFRYFSWQWQTSRIKEENNALDECMPAEKQPNASPLQIACTDLISRQLIDSTFPSSLISETNLHSLNGLSSTIYVGFDPTNDSLHIGNLVILMAALRAYIVGCHLIILIGSSTAQIGDPSGRKIDRDCISPKTVAKNTEAIKLQVLSIAENLTHIEMPLGRLTLVDNTMWYNNMTMIDFLNIGRSMRMGEMLKRKAVRLRLDQFGLNFAEFSYQILQAYDWVRLCQQYDCCVQFGGSDQLGHFDAGRMLIDRLLSVKKSFAFCIPLFNNDKGEKFGKSTMTDSSGMWLSAEKTSPYSFFQFFKQKKDSEMDALFRAFSFKTIDQINQLMREHYAKPSEWKAQTELAREVTELVHGTEGVNFVEKCSRALFYGSRDDFLSLGQNKIEVLFKDSTSTLHIDKLNSGTLTVLDLARTVLIAMHDHPNSATAYIGEGKGGFKINGNRMTCKDDILNCANTLLPNLDLSIISFGRRKHFLIKWI